MKYSLFIGVLLMLGTQITNAQTCGSTNVALNKTVLTSSNGSGTSGAGVTDGLVTSASTIWLPSYSGNNWAEIDLGTSKTVCRVLIKWGRYNAASSFKIQMASSSGNNATWTDIATVTNNNPTVGNQTGDYYTQYVYNDLNITGSSRTGRYIRLKTDTIPGANWWVSEMEVYESAGTNSVPSVSLNNPNAPVTIAVNTPLLLSANATDVDGTISEVSFLNGSTVLGIAAQTSSPYTFTWIPTSTGTYNIKAKAVDNVGGIGESLVYTVTVTAASTGWGMLGNAVTTTNNISDGFLGTTNAQPLIVKTNNLERYRLTSDGKLLIGSTQLASGAPANTLLTVNGYIMAKGLKVTQLSQNWPDFVFERGYDLMPLPTLAEFIKKNKHLPGVPSAREIEREGLSVAENQAILLRKIEELTLYILQQQEQIDQLKKEIRKQ